MERLHGADNARFFAEPLPGRDAPLGSPGWVKAIGEHRYLVRIRQGADIIEIRVDTTPTVIARLTRDESDEPWIVEATAAYLIARQRADDLPPQLDLDDVAAAYERFEDDLRQQIADQEGSKAGGS